MSLVPRIYRENLYKITSNEQKLLNVEMDGVNRN
jgi:hypothetical protein